MKKPATWRPSPTPSFSTRPRLDNIIPCPTKPREKPPKSSPHPAPPPSATRPFLSSLLCNEPRASGPKGTAKPETSAKTNNIPVKPIRSWPNAPIKLPDTDPIRVSTLYRPILRPRCPTSTLSTTVVIPIWRIKDQQTPQSKRATSNTLKRGNSA